MEALDRQLAANLAANLEAERLYKARAEADVEKVAAARAEEVREVEKVVSRVVIVGGGCAGVFTAKALKGAISKGILEVTLVTPTEYVEWHGGHIRGLAVPKEADRSFAPSVVACVKGAKVVQGKAISVTSDAIIVASRGQSEPVTVPYDLLVIATGGRYANPTTAFLKSPEVRSRFSIAAGLPHPCRLADDVPRHPLPQNATGFKERVAEIQAKSAALVSAKTVTIVGAGATGIELACDICHFYPQVQVRSMLDRVCHDLLAPKSKLALPRPLRALMAQS